VARERAPAQQQAGLVFFLEQAGGLLAGDRGLRQILMFATHGQDRVGEVSARLLPVVSKLAMLAEYTHPVRPGVWRRYLAIILDGLRPARATVTPLPEPPLSPAEIGTAMRAMPAGARPARPHEPR
jgi:hypothetical protein